MGGALGKLWEMINTLQILYYMPLIQVHYTKFFKKCMKFLDFAQGDFEVPGSDKIINYVVDTT